MLLVLTLPLIVKCKFYKKVKNPRISKGEKLGFRQLCKLYKFVTVGEVVSYLVIPDVPCKVFLKYTVSECIAKLVNDSVETRFGGVRLPTSIKDANELITNLSNLVTVQVHSRDALIITNRGVSTSPVSTILDGGVHEGLNFTHVVVNKGDQGVWMGCRSGSETGSNCSALEFAYQLVKHKVSAVVIIHEGAINSTVKCFGESVKLCFGESNGDHGGCLN